MNKGRRTAHIIALILITLFSGRVIKAQTAIIPQPASITHQEGKFVLSTSTQIILIPEQELSDLGEYLSKRLAGPTGYSLKLSDRKSDNAITLRLSEKPIMTFGGEGYRLVVNAKGIEIEANTTAGIFYGIQTLIQLLPNQITSNAKISADWKVSAIEVNDRPRFAWRGIMLDVSRHFFPKEYLFNFIDQIAAYKFNRLHLHLTDDQGWRIEIKSYPKLTSTGAWRVPRTGTFGKHAPPKAGEKPTYGGFYTQDDIREIVAYARSRFVEILPEIDVPGHSMAALAAYPELCVTKDSTLNVNPGSSFSTWHGAGKFTMHLDNTLNPTDESVYKFIDKIVEEVASLFPFEYIHMGGDECYKGFWERDPKVQAFMKKNKIASGHDLQAYFTDRVNKIVKSKGKKMMGWDEIIEGELSTDAAVMSWQGTKGGIAASKRKHTVIMSPAPHYYLDMRQGDLSIEPPVYDHARLKDVYNFNIVPPAADSTYILGGQGNLWTEQIPTTAQVEYMIYPRAFAIAETLWSTPARKEWSDFVRRTEEHFQRLKHAKINYAESIYDPIIKVSKNTQGVIIVDMTMEAEGLELFYTVDNAIPNEYHSKYDRPIEFPADADNFRVISYRNGVAMGRLISLSREDLIKRIKK